MLYLGAVGGGSLPVSKIYCRLGEVSNIISRYKKMLLLHVTKKILKWGVSITPPLRYTLQMLQNSYIHFLNPYKIGFKICNHFLTFVTQSVTNFVTILTSLQILQNNNKIICIVDKCHTILYNYFIINYVKRWLLLYGKKGQENNG